MIDVSDPGGGIWPETPPEVPPPWLPDQPEEPERRPAAPHVPMVLPAERPSRRDEWGLLGHRIVLLFGPLDHDMATRAAAELMALDADGGGQIGLHVSCQDGELLAALLLAETIDLAATPVVATATGVVGGAALAPFAAADRRLGSPNVTFRLSEPRESLSGVASEVTAAAEELRRHLDRLHRRIAAVTGQTRQTVAEDMRRGRVLDAVAARDYGLLDEIITGSARGR